MKVIKKHLVNFHDRIQDYNGDKLLEYLYYLQSELNFRNSTIKKNLSFVKSFLKWSFDNNYLNDKSFENFKPKFKTISKKIIFLTPSELRKLKKYKIPNSKQYLEKVRDVFIFQCYTGLRFSDVENLKKTDIKGSYIEVTTIKTGDTLKIDLNKKSKKILKKYKQIKSEKALPTISNQKTNDYLKELAELVGINEPITETYYIGNKRYDEVYPKFALLSSHAGRRTFICNALALGIPVQIVMKWTGHSDYKSMKPYIDIADEMKASEMKKFNKL